MSFLTSMISPVEGRGRLLLLEGRIQSLNFISLSWGFLNPDQILPLWQNCLLLLPLKRSRDLFDELLEFLEESPSVLHIVPSSGLSINSEWEDQPGQ